MPLLIDLFTYWDSMCPVIPVIIGWGSFFWYKNSLIRVVDSYPSIIGILQSIRIKSKLQYVPKLASTSDFTVSRAFFPLIAYTHTSSVFWTPKDSKITLRAILLNYSSSTINIFFFLWTKFFKTLSFSAINKFYASIWSIILYILFVLLLTF